MSTTSIFNYLAKRIVNGFTEATVELNGVSFSVEVTHDYDVNPGEFDCYTTEELIRFNNNDWRYLDVTLTVESFGVKASAQLGAIEHGLIDSETESEYLALEVLNNLFIEVQENFRDAARQLEKS